MRLAAGRGSVGRGVQTAPLGRGPIREIHAGFGYGSQDAAVQVLALPETPSALWMRGSGGRSREVTLPEGCREVVVNASGEIPSAR